MKPQACLSCSLLISYKEPTGPNRKEAGASIHDLKWLHRSCLSGMSVRLVVLSSSNRREIFVCPQTMDAQPARPVLCRCSRDVHECRVRRSPSLCPNAWLTSHDLPSIISDMPSCTVSIDHVLLRSRFSWCRLRMWCERRLGIRS